MIEKMQNNSFHVKEFPLVRGSFQRGFTVYFLPSTISLCPHVSWTTVQLHVFFQSVCYLLGVKTPRDCFGFAKKSAYFYA